MAHVYPLQLASLQIIFPAGPSFPEVKIKLGAIFLEEIKAREACDDAAAACRSWLPRVGDRCAQREGYCCIGHAGARSAHEGGRPAPACSSVGNARAEEWDSRSGEKLMTNKETGVTSAA
jgi:hypothetical protein